MNNSDNELEEIVYEESVPSQYDASTGDDIGVSRLRQNSANRRLPSARVKNATVDASKPNKTNQLGNKGNNQGGNGLGNKGSMPAAQNLLKNKFNKARNLPFFNRKKKKQGTENANDDSVDNSSAGNSGDEKVDLIKKAKKIKMIASIVVACLPIIFIIFVIVIIMSTMGSLLNMFGIVSTGGGGDFPTSMTDNPNEQKYYEKLDSVVASYRTKCGISLNKNYIHAILFYPIQNYDEFFDQEFSVEDSSNDVDYKSLAGKVDTVAKLMVNNCSVDYEVGGTSYERVKNSSFFKKYYKDMLEETDADDILTSVFELAAAGTEMFSSTWFITDNLKVTMGTCEQPYNNKLLNEGTYFPSTIGFSEYVMGAIYGEVGSHNITNETKEFLKAFTIATSSYALSRSKYQSGDTEIWVHNGDCWQLSCDIKNGCTYAYDLGKYGTTYSGNVQKDETAFTVPALSEEKINILKDVFSEVFGTVMLDPDGGIKWAAHYNNSANSNCQSDCLGQEDAILDSKNGMTYEEILEKYYDNFTLSNASEDLYADNVAYDDGGYTSNVVYYNQKDYNNKFCGRTDGTIATSGCGVVSMAIVLSTLVDDSYTPPVVMNEAYNFGSCGSGISGTATSFFKKSAKLHDLGYQRVAKKGDLQAVLNALNSGNSLVIAHMGPGTFTRSGHYIVLARVNSDGKVYVYDPNNPNKNGWHDFNSVIVKQLRGSFYIITKG